MKYQYYPTPATLGEKLAKMIRVAEPPILEPSAGTGNLIEAFIEAHRYGRWEPRYSEKDFHCIELNPERAAALKGKECRVVWDNFLTFNPLTPYQTIIMNPPFHEGAKHLQKALNLLADGGEIACILNAETIRNPYSNERKALIDELEAQEVYEVEFAKSAFEDTDVEVALIHVKKKSSPLKCITFENFKKSIVAERENSDPQSLIRHGEVNALIDNYRAEVKAALYLFDEIQAFKKLAPDSTVFKIDVSGGNTRANVVRAVNGIYWSKLLYSSELDRLLTADARNAYANRFREMANYEFNERNILQLKADLVSNLFENVDAAIMKVWENFTSRFSWTDYSKNIHYYNGWRTNKAFKCNKKVIIPLYAFDRVDNTFSTYHIRDALADIEKAMNYLDSGRTDGTNMTEILRAAQAQNCNRNIDTKFFTVDLYKKGTCHLTFKDAALLKKFNLYCGRRKKWLPDDYGCKPYGGLSQEEKEIVDSFEGRDSYEDTRRNSQFYLPTGNLPMLAAAGSN